LAVRNKDFITLTILIEIKVNVKCIIGSICRSQM